MIALINNIAFFTHDQSKDEHVENHYCDIDESAMIKTVNLSEKSYENECML
jgi:hypothetical protein